MSKPINAKFEMNIWQRIKAACGVWWAIVITKEIGCFNDEKLETTLKPILEGSVKIPPFIEIPNTDFFGKLDLHKPELAYHYGWESAMFECGEIIAKFLEEK